MTIAKSDPVSIATGYLSRHGLALIPLRASSKAALETGWPDSASTDQAQWEAWRAAGFNLGIHAGMSRLIIVDLDTTKEGGRAGAWERYSAWCATHGQPVFAPHCSTARQGMHVYFKLPPGADATLKGTDLAEGINVLCGRRYAVAPGSTVDFGPYALFPDAPAPHEAPDALIKHCTPAPLETSTGAPGQLDRGEVAKLVEWLADEGAFEDYESWVSVGMAIAAEHGDTGLEIWRLAHDNTVTPDVEAAKWRSFDKEPKAGAVTLATWIKKAWQLGWTGSIGRSSKAMFADVDLSILSPSIVPATAQREYLLSSAAFVCGFVPPDYLIDGILQKGFLYGVTAKTGVGKTAVAIRIAAHVSAGRNLGDLEVAKGSVLYFAGENPIDVRMRWLGQTAQMGMSPETADVHFIDGVVPLSQVAQQISAEVMRKQLALSLIVVDTAAAFNEGDEENSNSQAGEYARRLRSLTRLPGNPCVIVLCHPAKNASDEELVPRGGSAFLNEIDGNIGLRKIDVLLTASVHGKFRGPEFSPINFELITVRDHPKLRDARGRHIPTVTARPITADDKNNQRQATSRAPLEGKASARTPAKGKASR